MLKLVACSSTPVEIAGVLILVPGLASLVGLLYAIYLLCLGPATVLRTPSDQVAPFVVVSALALLVINIILSLVFSRSAGPHI